MDKQQKKWNMVAFNSTHQAKKPIYIYSGWFERQQRGVRIVSSKFSEPKRFVCRLNIVEGKYIKDQQPN